MNPPPPMAASDRIPGITDVEDKPGMLLTLLKEYVPDENHPLRDPSVLSHVISDVKNGKLLSESSSDQKVNESWKSAVDSWVKRILALASSNMPDNRWMGTWLLGLICQECSSERFLASYSVWFNEISSHIQSPSTSHLRVASCISLSGLMMRLAEFPKAKKDGNSHATRLVQRLLKLLNEDRSDDILEEALYLLCVIMNVFPSSVGRDYDNVEATIVSKIMSGNANATLLKKLSLALALLPKSRGDEDSWVLLMQKILVFINNQLKVLFQGLEEEASVNEVMKMLLPSGKDPPSPLGGIAVSGKLPDVAIQRPEQFLVSRVSTLMLCCCEMLSNVYPVQVNLPVLQVLALVRRVLRVDGSLSHAYPFTSSMNLEFIRLGLPVLRMHSLELLDAIVKGLHSELYRYLGDIIRLLKEYFQTCAHPELRVKVYSIVKLLLESAGIGAGIAEDLIQEIINNVFIDLHAHDQQRIEDSAASEALQQPPRKKRKHLTTPGSLAVQSDQCGLKADRSPDATLIAVRIAALEALGALLTVAGAWQSDSWRPSIDHLIMTVATNACEGWWTREKSTSVYVDATPVWKDFQLAALRAFLKSILSPGHAHPPPHLAQGLHLFQRGTQETGTKIAEFCLDAVLDLDLLMHPRALPMADFQSRVDHLDSLGIKIPEIMYSSDHSTPFRVCSVGKKGTHEAESYEDDLYRSWLENGEVMEEDPVVNLQTKARNAEEALGASKHPSLEKVTYDFPSGTSLNRLEASAVDSITRISADRDEMMVESSQKQKRIPESEEHDHTKGGSRVSLVSTRSITIAQSDQLVSGSSTLEEPTDHASTSGKGAFMADKEAISSDDKISVPTSGNDVETGQGDVHNTILENISASVSNADSKNAVYEIDDDSSVESFPDIVDADPDSD